MEPSSAQASLFDPEQYHKDIAALSLIEPGYYFIASQRVYVRIDGRKHVLSLWNPEREAWWAVANLWQTDEAAVFNYYPNPGVNKIQPYFFELMAHPAKYRSAYGREVERCGCCNRELKSERQKHYGIGIECETKPGNHYLIELVDEANGGKSWEELQR